MPEITDKVLQALDGKGDKDLKKTSRLSLLPIIVMGCLLTGAYIKESYFDASGYVTVQKLIGPISCPKQKEDLDSSRQPMTGKCVDFEDVSATVAALPLVNVFHPGDTFGWVSTLCVEAASSIKARLRFVRIEGDQTETLETRLVTLPPGRCGPVVASQLIPENAKPGRYELQRSILMRQGTLFEFSKNLEPVSIQVVSRDN